MSPDTAQARVLTKDFATVPISKGIEHDKNRTAAKIASLISTGETKLAAAQGIVDSTVGSDTVKLGKDAILSLLAPAKEIVGILDAVAQIHPAVQVAVGIVKVVIQLEMDRQENDKHIAALYFSMTDLLFVLAYLDPVFEDDDGLKSQLEKQLKAITDNINAFGNFCDVYYKHKSVVRTIFSGRYKGKLADFAKAFTDQKSELQFLVIQKSAATVTAMKGSLDGVSKKMDKLVAFLEKKTPEEQQAVDMVARRGGEAAVIENEKLLIKIGTKLGEKITSDMRQEMKFILRSTLDESLRSNQALYNLKFDAVQAHLEHAIERSTQTILSRLDSGPHDLIHDEDIRAVWKEMQWRISCKVRYFVDAVHHHFAQKFAEHQRATGEIHPHAWTLNYMSKVIFHPAIGDAIDSDGSGYLSVTEVDRFFLDKPKHWGSSEWIAYWAVGWYKNAIILSNRCKTLLESLEASRATVLEQNKEYIDNSEYFDEECLPRVRLIVESIYTGILQYHSEDSIEGNERLHVLRTERMSHEISTMRAQLSKPKYKLDGTDAVSAVFPTDQMEFSCLCLLNVLLVRHQKIFNLAQTYVLSDEEFWIMADTIWNVQEAFDKRYRDLVECWRQQRLDIAFQTESYAAGIFEDWHLELYENNDSSDDSDNEEGDEEDEDEEGEEENEAGDQQGADTEDITADTDESQANDGTVADEGNGDTDGSTTGTEADDASVIDEQGELEKEPVDPLEILIFPLPPQPEATADTGATHQKTVPTDQPIDDSDDIEEEQAPKKKKETKIERRVTAIETRLEAIEKLLTDAELDGIGSALQELVSATKALRNRK